METKRVVRLCYKKILEYTTLSVKTLAITRASNKFEWLPEKQMMHNISMVSVINIHESTTWTTRTNRYTTIWVQFSQSGEKISRSPYWHSWVDSTDFRLVSFSWFPQWIFMNLRLVNILDDWYQAVVLDNPPKKSRTLLTFLWKRRSGDACFTCWNGKAIIL